MEGIQVGSSEGPNPFRRGDDSKNNKIISKTYKIIFCRTTWSISTKLGTKLAWVVVIQTCSNKGPQSSPSGYNIEIVKCYLIYIYVSNFQREIIQFEL